MTSTTYRRAPEPDRASPIIRIEKRFNGPPDAGHGGVCGGRFAEPLNGSAARVRFHQMVPLATDLTVHEAETGCEVRHKSRTIATVQPLPDDLVIRPFRLVPMHVVDVAEQASFAAPGAMHPYPTCFGCGNARHGGLGLTPGPVAGSEDFVAAWIPGSTGDVPEWMVWAALDCPSGAPALAQADDDHLIVTGELAVQINAPVAGDEQHQIQSRVIEHRGRKIRTETALLTSTGSEVAVALATWITIPRFVESSS